MRWPGAPGGAWRSQDQRELVEEVRIGLAQAEGDRARRVIGDDPRMQVAPPRLSVARLRAEDALVVGGTGAEAELALDAAAEVRRPHGRAVGVPDARAQRERVRRAAVGRARQRNGQVRDERAPQRAVCFAERDQSVVDGGERRRSRGVVRLYRVTPRQVLAYFGQGAAAVAGGRERPRRHPDAGPGRRDPPRRASHRDDPADPVGVRVDPVQRRTELTAHPHAVRGHGDRPGPVTHADGGGHLAGHRVEPGHGEVQ